MKKEDLSVLAQLFTAMKDAVDKLEEAQKKKDMEMMSSAKKSILALQSQIKQVLY